MTTADLLGIDDALRDVPRERLETAIRSVLNLHEPVSNNRGDALLCGVCVHGESLRAEPWPCTTVQLLAWAGEGAPKGKPEPRDKEG